VPVDPITPELRQFVAKYVRSVEHVEVLRLLSTAPIRSWNVGTVFRQVQSSEKSVAECLEGFLKAELLVSETAGSYCFAPKDPSLAKAVAELASAYRERRVTIIELIYGKPADALQDFSDAFKFRKEK
jgi:hypothetical protein